MVVLAYRPKGAAMLRPARSSVFVLSLYSSLVTASLAQNPRPMTLVDMMNIPQVSDPQMSTDGRRILFVRSEPDWTANRRVGHIWRVNSDGSGSIQLTTGTEGESGPRWSPDGKTIAFI
jgi:Tol biopolymer transport system component